MLAVVATAFEASNCQVIGTATSGQATRTLGGDADLREARTPASLLWRFDHDQIVLDERSVVILDEAGMTEDAHLVALTARAEAAGAKLITVGDPYQLGAVGPGGALAALVRRHPEAVHELVENRRQADSGERHALGQLRAGKAAATVAWYHQQGRIHPAVDRDQALQQAVDAWGADTAAGHDTGLYAWRRANVAALNQQARAWMETTGLLSGPELVCAGGRSYQAGDHVITLTPGAEGELVTSQRAVIRTVDPDHDTFSLVTDAGQHVHLHKDEAGADRLDYGYATTVHRAQGATVARAHLYADGGGQELAYVALSRARESTQVWIFADDLPQALDDLRRDWSTRRTPTWAIDTTLPDLDAVTPQSFQSLPPDQQARLAAQARAEQAIGGQAIVGIRLPDRAATLGQAPQQALDTARQARADLDTGTGVWQHTPVCQAVRDLTEARVERERAEQTSEHARRWRDRRAIGKQATHWAAREADAQRRWTAHVAPQIALLDHEIARHQTTLDQTAARLDRHRTSTRAVIDHGLQQQRATRDLARPLAAYRDQIDGVAPTAEIRRTAAASASSRTEP
jgi:hypothetical protein